jgi:hypothetical protein
MRAPLLPLVLALAFALAACTGAPPAKPPDPETSDVRDPRTRVVYRQYRQGSGIFVMENLAGRDLKEMRSKPLRPGHPPVAYVPDDVMRKMLKEFKRLEFQEHAVPRPRNPMKLGASGEITLIDEQRRMVSLLRIKAPVGQEPSRQHMARGKAYVGCAQTFLAVWNHFRPRMQATTSGGFGVRRADEG